MAEVADNTMVDSRYRILNRIGSGGMADVYRAQDTHLGREVAIKMLHRRFSADEDFVERFRREASSAASLQHPNVVNVFDRGEHDGTYYIAMEHLSGSTLKQLIDAEAPLDQERAIDLGIQVLKAAGFAHRRSVIHRDLKPHNVIVGGDGTAKVTDFGIARAGASEMTETGSIMGTAQYLSPEQAQGHSVSPASDIYSIGVLLYEALAGQVPFHGESAVSIALKHLNEPPPPLSRRRPDIHPDLERVVVRALAKDPAQRYTSAEEMIAALEAARAAIRSAANGERTTVFAPVAPPPVHRIEEETELPPPLEPDDRRRPRWPWIALLVLALAGIGLALFAVLGRGDDPVRVPAVEGKRLEQAQSRLEAAGFDVAQEDVRNRAPVGEVVSQDPAARALAQIGSTVTLSVSTGPGRREVPEVNGLSRRQAVRALRADGFRVEAGSTSSDSVPEGRVIRADPRQGERATVGSRVRLVVSTGPEQVEVPNVTGLSRESAESRLRDEGFSAEVSEEESERPRGEVISQSPGDGTSVDRGSAVAIVVSTGIPTVEVPDVLELSQERATAEINGVGLNAEVREKRTENEDEDGTVLVQRPPPGSERERGRTVVILVGRFESPDGESLIE